VQLVFNETNKYSPILCLVCSRTHLRLTTWFIFKDIDDDFLIEDENGKTHTNKPRCGVSKVYHKQLVGRQNIFGLYLPQWRSCAWISLLIPSILPVQLDPKIYYIEVYWYDVFMVIHSRMDWITCIKKQQCHAYYITLIFPAFLSQYLGPPNHYFIKHL
jgi:hypothetical protein